MLKEYCRRSDEKNCRRSDTHPNISTTCKFQINIKKTYILNEETFAKPTLNSDRSKTRRSF